MNPIDAQSKGAARTDFVLSNFLDAVLNALSQFIERVHLRSVKTDDDSPSLVLVGRARCSRTIGHEIERRAVCVGACQVVNDLLARLCFGIAATIKFRVLGEALQFFGDLNQGLRTGRFVPIETLGQCINERLKCSVHERGVFVLPEVL